MIDKGLLKSGRVPFKAFCSLLLLPAPALAYSLCVMLLSIIYMIMASKPTTACVLNLQSSRNPAIQPPVGQLLLGTLGTLAQ